MKKLLSALALIAILICMVVPASAAGSVVMITEEPVPGGMLYVDIEKTIETSDAMMAQYLDGKDVVYTWYKNDSLMSGKNSAFLTFTDADVGSSFYVKVTCGSESLTSKGYTVRKPSVYPTILTKTLPTATVGVPYEILIDCADDMAVFSLFRSPDFDKTGLTLDPGGRLSGTPTQVGIFVFTVVATGIGGEEDMVTYEFTVVSASEPPEITTTTLPAATVGQYYSTTIKCSDSKASIQEYYNPGKANDFSKTGLTLSTSGKLEGTPRTPGTYTFTVSAVGEGGEDYQSYTLVVEEAEVTIELVSKPDKMTYKVGEEIDLTGLVVKITKADGTIVEAKDGELVKITAGDKLEEPGKHDVTISYEDVSVTITLKVTKADEEETEPTEETEPEEEGKKKTSKSKRENKDEDDEQGPGNLILILIMAGTLILLIGAVVVVITIVKKKKSA